MIPNMTAMDSVMTSHLPPPAPSDPAPVPISHHSPPQTQSPPSVGAAAIKDIKKAVQSVKTLQQSSPGPGPDPWLPRSNPLPVLDPVEVQQLPLPASSSPSLACTTSPPSPQELQEESKATAEEERVPTPEVMKEEEEEDLETGQVFCLSPFLIGS